MPRLARLVLALSRPRPGGRRASRCRHPRRRHEERPAQFPDGTRRGADVPRLRQPQQPRGLQADSASRIADDARRRGQAAQPAAARAAASSARSRTRSTRIQKRNTSIYVLPGVYEERKWAGNRAQPLLLPPRHRRPTTPLPSSRVHRQHLLPRGAGARRPGRGGRRHDQPDRAVVRRPAPLPAQPQPDRGLRRPAPPATSRSAATAEFCGTQIVGTGRRMTDVTDRQPFTEAQRDPAGPRRRRRRPQHDRPAGRVQRASTCSRPTGSCSTG